MSKVYTPLGPGSIRETSVTRGTTSYLVEGSGFSVWFKDSEVFIDDQEVTINEDNSTELPYDPTPQVAVPEGESTLQPVYEIDEEERLTPIDSLDVNELLGSKYVKVPELNRVDPDSTEGRLRNDPERFARESRTSHKLSSVDDRIVDALYLMDSDESFREAAWKDVRAKAVRLRTTGSVNTTSVTPRAIYATVKGDHGTYETIVVRGGAVVGSGSITEWACSCPWGQHAFLRQHTYVGRLCSHAYAAYMELQSATRIQPNPNLEKKKRVRSPKNPYSPALMMPRASGLNVEETAYFPETHFHQTEDVEEDTRSYGDYDQSEDEYNVASLKSSHAVCPDTGYYAHYTKGAGGDLVLGIYNPLDELVQVVEPSNGEFYEEGEDVEAVRKFVEGLGNEELYGEGVEHKASFVYEYEGWTLQEDVEGYVAVSPNGGYEYVLESEDEDEAVDSLVSFVNGMSDSERRLYSFRDPSGFAGSGPRDPLDPSSSAERSEREDEFEDVTEATSRTSRSRVGSGYYDQRAIDGDARLVNEVSVGDTLFDSMTATYQTVVDIEEGSRGRKFIVEDEYGSRGFVVLETGRSASRQRTAGRKFTWQEQMALINEATGDEEVLRDLDLRGTHYVR